MSLIIYDRLLYALRCEKCSWWYIIKIKQLVINRLNTCGHQIINDPLAPPADVLRKIINSQGRALLYALHTRCLINTQQSI